MSACLGIYLSAYLSCSSISLYLSIYHFIDLLSSFIYLYLFVSLSLSIHLSLYPFSVTHNSHLLRTCISLLRSLLLWHLFWDTARGNFHQSDVLLRICISPFGGHCVNSDQLWWLSWWIETSQELRHCLGLVEQPIVARVKMNTKSFVYQSSKHNAAWFELSITNRSNG